MEKEENQASGHSLTIKSMLEKLTEHYWWCSRIGNGGHAAGYYSQIPEKIQSEYVFPKGKFTLRRVEGLFCRWDYDPFPA